MIVTSYTRLVIDCHREELNNRLNLATNGFLCSPARPRLPVSYRDDRQFRSAPTQPLAVGPDALDLTPGEIRGTA
jgi:hypothetical protein